MDVTVTVNGRTSTVIGRTFSYIPVDSGLPTAPSEPSPDAWTTTSVEMSWLDNSTNETYFDIRYSPKSSENWQSLTVPADTPSVTITRLRPGTWYRVAVRACNTAGCSGWSPEGSAATPRLDGGMPGR